MADKPLAEPLPADLPEDWTDGQIVAPFGPSVDLSERHGYNYLMAAVNAAHRAVNAVNDGFETITGKRTARFVVGTATAGWTDSDCDYLCDGTDDQEELNAACAAASSAGGGEVVLLAGQYRLTGTVTVPGGVTLRGNGDKSTTLLRKAGTYSGDYSAAVVLYGNLLNAACSGEGFSGFFVHCPDPGGYPPTRISGVTFLLSASAGIIHCQPVSLEVSRCRFAYSAGQGAAVQMDAEAASGASGVGTGALSIQGCEFSQGCTVKASYPYAGNRPVVSIVGNRCFDGGFAVELDGVKPGSVVSGNDLSRLKLLSCEGCLIAGNAFLGSGTAVTLGAGTRYSFVTGNQFTRPETGDQLAVEDGGEDNIVRYNSDGKGSPLITYGTADLTPGVSALPTGTVYLVYE